MNSNSLVSMQNILDLVLFLINNDKRGIVHLSGLNEISYYQEDCLTIFGILGIKVWVIY